jgi:hypothetical protein
MAGFKLGVPIKSEWIAVFRGVFILQFRAHLICRDCAGKLKSDFFLCLPFGGPAACHITR